MSASRCVMALTGASGMVYAVRLAPMLARAGVEVHGVVSGAGRRVLELECGLAPEEIAGVARWFPVDDCAAPMASGSARYGGMVVAPCTMATLGALASGAGRNLIHRAADVMLKERRPLVLAVRETPLHRIHLRNMLELADAGAVICPLAPGFYHRPGGLDDLVRAMAARLAALLGVRVPEQVSWQGESA